MSMFRKELIVGLIGASISTAALVAMAGAAFAQQPLTKEELERRKAQQQQQQQKGPPPTVNRGPPPQVKQAPPPATNRTSPPPPPVVKRDSPPPVIRRESLPPPVKQVTPPPPVNRTPPPPPVVKRETLPPPAVKLPPPAVKQATPPPPPPPLVKREVAPPPLGKRELPPTLPATGPATRTTVTPPAGTNERVVTPAVPAVRPIGTPPPINTPGKTVIAPIVGPRKLDEIKTQRVERKDSAGRVLFVEPGNRTLIKKDNRFIIHRDESKTILALRPDARTVRLPNGINQTIYVRPDGVRVYSEFDSAGRLIRRYGRPPGGGRDIVYLDNRRFYRNLAIGAGIGLVGAGLLLALSPPVHALPRPKYIVEYDTASDDDLYEALTAPPVVRLERSYSLDEIRYSQPLRERMRRIDIDGITFDTGSFEISEDQYGKLERMAKVIARVIDKNPAEMFLIEGHTDAVGQEDDNLTLSDRRAEAVARVLTEYYNIPMENLTTQGYGEQHLKVDTQGPERANRRASFRRIGPLLDEKSSGG